jgi:hypothetical protein
VWCCLVGWHFVLSLFSMWWRKLTCNIALIGTMIPCLTKYSHGHINKIWTYSSDWNSDSVFRFLWCQHESTLVRIWSDVGAGVMQLQSRKDHIIFGQRQPTVWRMISRTCCHKHNRLSWRIGWRMSQFWRSKCIRCCGDGRQSYKLSLLLHCWYVLPWHSLLLLLTSLRLSVQGCTQTEFFMLSLQAETSSVESIDTWSGVEVKMMRMMML